MGPCELLQQLQLLSGYHVSLFPSSCFSVLSVCGGSSGLLAAGGEFLSISWTLGAHLLVSGGLDEDTRGLESAIKKNSYNSM
jgi:hypothetical protein